MTFPEECCIAFKLFQPLQSPKNCLTSSAYQTLNPTPSNQSSCGSHYNSNLANLHYLSPSPHHLQFMAMYQTSKILISTHYYWQTSLPNHALNSPQLKVENAFEQPQSSHQSFEHQEDDQVALVLMNQSFPSFHSSDQV